MLLSIALHTNGRMLPLISEIIGIVLLACSYLCATCINDLVDWKSDQINLKGNSERPLINGLGTRQQLIILAIVGAAISIALGFVVSTLLGIVMIVSIMLNTLYSLPPVRVSYRPLLTPFYLAFCYVVVSYVVGYILVEGMQVKFIPLDWLYLLAFYFLFIARIALKDFRDRKGDSKVGKPTIILKYGKTVVCTLSIAAAASGIISLLFLYRQDPWLLFTIVLFGVSIGFLEYRLFHAKVLNDELMAIAHAARMGNGLLLTILGWLLLKGQHATEDVIIVFMVTILFVYGYTFWLYLRHADEFLVGGRRLKIK